MWVQKSLEGITSVLTYLLQVWVVQKSISGDDVEVKVVVVPPEELFLTCEPEEDVPDEGLPLESVCELASTLPSE